jgi:tetratricopeptide (TPR) repeat protein
MAQWSSMVLMMLMFASARPVLAQSFEDMRRAYEAGNYQQVVESGADASAPDDQQLRAMYLKAQAYQKLSQTDNARELYERLVSRGESDPWRDVGRSALALLDSNPADAVEAANQAVSGGDSLAEAHFARGMALRAKQDMAGAAAEFERASQLDPQWAYAHYYAGVAYSRAKRIDQTASHFNRFLQLAPQAPERAEVQSILRTLGGRRK